MTIMATMRTRVKPDSKTRTALNRTAVLLAVLAAADGYMFTLLQLQNAMFLIDHNAAGIKWKLDRYKFEPHHYGPFDRQVHQDIEQLYSDGMAVISKETDSPLSKYGCSPEGIESGQKILLQLPELDQRYITRVANWVREASFYQMVSAVCSEYPTMADKRLFE